MKKSLGRALSWVLCLSLLWGIVAPTGALAARNDETPEFPVLDEVQSVQSMELPSQAEPLAADGEYEIYPTPQSVSYGTGTVTLPGTMQVIYGEGIDQYTKDRAVEAFKEAGVSLSESTTTVKLSVSIGDTGNNSKYDAYKLTIDQNGVTVVGKDTDAAFYGLTTAKRILQQVKNRQVKHLTVEDYADVPFRGFIEGYYGNPWTVEDRAALMEFGGEYKMNIYFYAPKDDPKHSTKWREPYTDEELETKIRPLAEAGNKSKCYYGFALHPFWADTIDYNNEASYAKGLADLKAKFEQVMGVGVRQIAVLADDRGLPGVGVERSYVRLMTDLTEWVSSEAMQTSYPGLKTSIPFCPNAYMNNGSDQQLKDLVNMLPDSVPIVLTGGAIWGHVSHSFLNTYRTNTSGGRTFMWVNWPCSDNSKTSITMGAHDVILHNDLTEDDIGTLQGIMLNPMQQSEPSKAGIFYNADYAWNIWNGEDHQERKDNVWYDSFKYVDHDSAIETAESAALRELAKHMIRQNGNGNNSYNESLELAPELTAFRQKLSAGTLTAADVAAMRAEFQTLNDAAVLYKNKTTGNTRILGSRNADGSYPNQQEQMAPWLDCWVEFSQANLDLLDALEAILTNGKNSDIVNKYLSGQSNLTASQGHKFFYVDYYETAKVGGQHLIPFANDLLAAVAEEAKTIINPTILVERVITSRNDTPVGGLEAMRDGNIGTWATFKDPNTVSVGDYFGVKYNRPIAIDSVRFEMGDDGQKNSLKGCKLEYTEDGDTWKDVPGTPSITYGTGGNSAKVASVEQNDLGLTASGIRLTATEALTDVWVSIKEIILNGQSDSGSSTAASGSQLTGTVIKTDSWSVASGSQASSLTDGNDSTSVEYDPDGSPNSRSPADTSFVGDFIGLDLGEVVANVGRVRLVIGNGSSDNKWTNFKLQYSTDNTNWTDVKTYTSTNQKDVIDENLGGVAARYIRFVNTVQITKWLHFAELSVWAGASAPAIYQSESVKKLSNPVAASTDSSASLSADSVSLRPGEFVGLDLGTIRNVTEIIANYTSADGLVLKVGTSEADMNEVFPDRDGEVAFEGPARYIRLENEGTQNVSFRLKELKVELVPMSGEGISYVRANGCQPESASDDPMAWFDGDIGTRAKFSAQQRVGNWVLYDLGQTKEIRSLRATINNTDNDYPRNGVWELSDSQDGPWTTVLTITTTLGAGQADFNNPPSTNGSTEWQHDTANYFYQENTLQTPVSGRYLRYRVTGASDNYLRFNEITINGGEYVSAFDDPAYTVDPTEISADFTPDKMRDSDLTTGFRPNMDGKTEGSIIYRLSDETSIGQINIVEGAASGATVSIRAVGSESFTELGTMSGGLGEFPIPEKVTGVAEIKLTWGNVTPTFYEIITIPREDVVESGGQAASGPETIPINSYSGTDRVINFDENWKFNLGDASGAEGVVCNDAAWRTVNLPHDYSIEGEYTSSGDAESGYLIGGIGWYRKSFTIDPTWENKVVTINFGGVYMDSEVYLNGTKLGEHHFGYSPFSFVLPHDILKYTGENVIAVRTDDSFPSSRWYSGAGIYRSVNLTVTDPVHVAKYGTKVETTNAGAVTVKTTVENNGSAAANVTVEQAIYELDGTTFEKKGSAVATASGMAASPAANSTADVTQTLSVTSPKLWNSWDRGTPNLYVLVTTVKQGSDVLDTYETEFGFRTVEFTSTVGFKLNGVNTKLKGVCQHHDQGGLGAEAWYRALERQVEILMDMGCNAIRVTHNPAADELIEICNRKGVLIIDEAFDTWTYFKNQNRNDFSRWFNQTITADNALVGKQPDDIWAKFVLRTMIRRDMNAPCVIMYSLGNELYEGNENGGSTAAYGDIAQMLVDFARGIDTTRPLTYGQNAAGSGNSKTQIAPKIKDAGGVVGINYRLGWNIETLHNEGFLVYASETVSHTNTRGIYDRKDRNGDGGKGDGLLTAYDKSYVNWGNSASDGWYDTIIRDYSAGEFIWTGFDYMGEPTPWNKTGSGWSTLGANSPKNSYFGAIDTNGLPKDNFWLYRSMWNDKSHTLHILPTWDESDLVIEDGKVEVVVYTDAPMVKLYLNNREVGSATTTTHTTTAGHIYRTFDAGTGAFVSKSGHQSLYATFDVTYAEGTLRAVACDENGQILNWVTQGRNEVKTTDRASKLVAEADRTTIKNDGRDLSYITISITDKDGNIVNGATDPITVSVEGDGVFMALDNGVQVDHTSFQSKTRKAGAGQLVAIVQSTKKAGQFKLTATAPGLAPTSVTVKTAGVVSSTTGTAPVSYDLAKTVYVQLNTEPTLPTTATVNLANGTPVTKSITWDEYDKSLLGTVGNEFAITGTIADYNIAVSVGVVVLDNIVALLNYSTAIQPGGTPALPASRPAVMADGTVVSAQFPVTWTPTDPKAFAKPGTVVITGTAEAFNKPYEVTATVRIANATISELGNVIAVAHMTPADGEALRDGNTATTWTGSGDLEFVYDTAFNLLKVNLKYSGALSASNVTISTSGNGTEWTTQAVRASIRDGIASFTLPTLESAVFVKISLAKETTLSEVELIAGSSTFPIGATAEFDGLKVNGLDVAESQLASKVIRTSAENAVITPISDDNVAVTILPENSDSQIIVVTESEDHAERALYTIQLDSSSPADDDSKDYPYTKTNVTTPSEQTPADKNVEGPKEFAVDNNPNTYWHSNWSENLTDQAGKRYIQLTLEETTKLSALRYLPRPSIANGIVTKYRVEVSTDGTNFTPVASGNWAHDTTWKIAEFGQSVTAKYVRLYGVETRGSTADTPNKFMSCAELRVVQADDRIDLSAATITLSKTEFHWKNLPLRPGESSNTNVDDDVTVTVTLYGETLVQGVDYELDYDNNVEPGTAYIYARALKNSTKYQGAAAATFQIVRTEDKITSFQPVIVRVYPGVVPELPTEVLATKEDQHRASVPVIWEEEAPEEWYYYPDYEKLESEDCSISGTIEDMDMVEEGAELPKLTPKFIRFQSADTISLVTAAGIDPVLPTTVTVRFADGTSEQRAVTWALEDVSFTTPGTIEITGDIEGVSHNGAKASVRVVRNDELQQNDDNIASNTSDASYTGSGDSLKLTAMADIFPFALSYWSSGNNNPYQAIKGQVAASGAVADRWSDWEQGNITHDSTWMGVAFETSTENVTATQNQVLTLVPHLVNKAKIMFVDESANGNGGAVTFPATYKLQYYTGPVEDLSFDTRTTNNDATPGNGRVRSWTGSPLNGDNWSDVTVKGTQPTVPSSNGQMLTVEFEPVNTAILRVLCTAQSGNHWVGIQAFEVYSMDIPANADFNVTSITLGGEEKLANFRDKTLEITLPPEETEIPALEVTADSNASIAIIQASRVPGAAKAGGAWAQAVITSEDGSKTETYTVKFTREGATSGYFIDLKGAAASSDKLHISPMGGPADTEITISVDRGYQLTDLWVQIADGDHEGELIRVTDGKFVMPADNVIFSAGVGPIVYTVKYVLNGGSLEVNNLTKYTVESAAFTLRNPTKDGYTFAGWIGGGLTTPAQTVTIQKGSIGDRVYTAVWNENSSESGNGGNTGTGGGGTAAVTPDTSVSEGGDRVATTTNPDGSTTVTTETPAGVTTQVTTGKDGEQTATIVIPESTVGTVEAVMPALVPGKDAESAPTVTVTSAHSVPTRVTIPVEGEGTTVAVRIEEDGTQTIVPMSVVDDDGLHLFVEDGETYKIIDNKKDFDDVPDTFWGASAVDFVASRELFQGVAERIFAPSQTMNRAMLVTVLWRMSEKPDSSVENTFHDVSESDYYAEAVRWGVENNVITGTDLGFEPKGTVTREMLATMLYRAAGSPGVVDELPRRFVDAGQVSGWAEAAMIWAVQNGIIQGREDNTLAPRDGANRAETAAMLQRYINLMV